MVLALAYSIIEAVEARALEASLPPERCEVLHDEMVRNRTPILELKALGAVDPSSPARRWPVVLGAT